MSVRLGISTRKVEKAQKKGAPAARPSSNCVRKPLAREASLARLRRFGKGFRPSSTVQFGQFARFIRRVRGLSPSPSTLSLRSSFAGHALPRRSGVAAPRVARQGEAWWGRKDSNLRSHEAADLQSAPFATRDTPPFNHTDKLARRYGGDQASDDAEVRQASCGGDRSGAFMGEAPWQSQPIRAANMSIQAATLEMPRRSSSLVKHDLFGKTGSRFFEIMLWGPKLPISGTHDTSCHGSKAKVRPPAR